MGGSGFGDAADHGVLDGLGDDDHAQYLNLARHSAVDHDNQIINHAGLENVTANQHHTENHASRHAPGGADEVTSLRSELTPTTWASSASPGARQLNTTFQPSTTRPVHVAYSVEIEAASTLLAQHGRIELCYDTFSPPTTVRESVKLQKGVTALLVVRSVLAAIIPTGYYVRINTVDVENTPTFSLFNHTETPL